jgi:prenylcysteine alpha-carboxyl methylesterase
VLLVSNLALKLYGYLFTGLSWWIQFLRLLMFAALLMPGFSQMILFYYFSPRVIRSVPYGTQSRNVLDIYLPRRKWRRKGSCPVVIYVTGGAWIIGYKAWGALFARRLSQRGILVFCLDYRNFPQGTIMDMVEDCNHGISWVMNNCHLYGGDQGSMYLVGQSAGVHLTLLALLAQSRRHFEGGFPLCSVPSWNPARLVGYIGVSGAFNVETLADHLHHRGLYRRLFSTIMSGPDGVPDFASFSPTLLIKGLPAEMVGYLPPMTLFHGTADNSVPVDNAIQFCKAVKDAGGTCMLHLYHNKSHTQPIVEDPMRGGRDKLMDDVLSVIRKEDCFNQQFPMVPSPMIDVASFVCPF